MRVAVRAIVIKDDKLLVMHRNKFGEEYDTLPGGSIEIGETPDQALVRELREETTLEIESARLIIIEHAGDPFGDQYIYLCKYLKGEPKLHPDSEEMAINRLGKNLYQPSWLDMKNLSKTYLVSENLKQLIIQFYESSNWPKQVVEITTNKI